MSSSSLWRRVCIGALLMGGLGFTPPTQTKFGDPVPGLTPAELARFSLGRTQFQTDETIETGLGPGFNDTSCGNCHNGPAMGGGSVLNVTRFGYEDVNGNFDPLAQYGGTLLQANAIVIDPENPSLCQEVIPPQANLPGPSFPPTLRITPPAFGFGLVEAIPDAAILVNVDPNDVNGDGISGRAHLVHPLENPLLTRVGRFGWKAQVPTTLSFSGDAFLNENGITNRLVPTENAPNGDPQTLALCDTVPEDPYEDFQISPGVEKIDAFTDFQQLLGVPPQWPPQGTLPGETVFNQVGCGACHIATWTTGLLSPMPNNGAGGAAFPALASKTIHPYSDWLLHDIGTADHIVFGDASGYEFRTTPLWGLRQRVALLHTGCVSLGSASTVEGFVPAIDAHGCVPAASCEFDPAGSQCEAQPSYAAFNALAAAQRTQLLDFLGSLGRKLFDSADSWPGDLRINLD
ncbi:MAG TPA: di-heme oxidoredictase family protein, partial [Phycisphaerae bacterium]